MQLRILEEHGSELEIKIWRKWLGIDTVLDRQGLPQAVQTRLSTASVDSEKLEWEVSSACCWASSTDLNSAPQSPHLRDRPAIDDGKFLDPYRNPCSKSADWILPPAYWSVFFRIACLMGNGDELALPFS